MEPAAAVMEVHLAIGADSLDLRLPVPEGPTSLRQMLPAVRDMSNAFIRIGVEGMAAQGQHVSCRAGCGACCRQLVPVAPAEAHALAELVSAMPAERRAVVQQRFDDALRQLDAADLRQRLGGVAAGKAEPMQALVQDYFAQAIACPFLEDESCAVHDARPVACREYLVVSPPERCASAAGTGVDNVVHLFKLKDALLQVDSAVAAAGPPAFVPMIMALDWAAHHPENDEAAEPKEWLDRLFQRMHALL